MFLKKAFFILYCLVPLCLSYLALRNDEGYVMPVVILNITYFVFTVLYFREFKVLSKKLLEHRIKNNTYIQIINHLKTLRHDYINYLQVICGFAQMGKYRDIKHQADKMVCELVSTGNICKMSEPVVALFLLKKVKEIVSKGIRVEVDIEFKLDKLPINTNDLLDIFKGVFEQVEKIFIESSDAELVLDFFEGENALYIDFLIITTDNHKKIKSMLNESIMPYKQKIDEIKITNSNSEIIMELIFYKNYKELKKFNKQDTVMLTG